MNIRPAGVGLRDAGRPILYQGRGINPYIWPWRESGGPGWNRTSNPQLRRLMLYPIELRAHRRRERIAIATLAMATLPVSMREMVGPAGIEPATLSLEG
jgi:hypothetical protein